MEKRGFSDQQIYFDKSTWKQPGFSTGEITPIKVRGNFSTIEIALKKFAEITWKFVEIWSSMYRRNIHVESTSIRRDVPVRKFVSLICLTIFSVHKDCFHF